MDPLLRARKPIELLHDQTSHIKKRHTNPHDHDKRHCQELPGDEGDMIMTRYYIDNEARYRYRFRWGARCRGAHDVMIGSEHSNVLRD